MSVTSSTSPQYANEGKELLFRLYQNSEARPQIQQTIKDIYSKAIEKFLYDLESAQHLKLTYDYTQHDFRKITTDEKVNKKYNNAFRDFLVIRISTLAKCFVQNTEEKKEILEDYFRHLIGVHKHKSIKAYIESDTASICTDSKPLDRVLADILENRFSCPLKTSTVNTPELIQEEEKEVDSSDSSISFLSSSESSDDEGIDRTPSEQVFKTGQDPLQDNKINRKKDQTADSTKKPSSLLVRFFIRIGKGCEIFLKNIYNWFKSLFTIKIEM